MMTQKKSFIDFYLDKVQGLKFYLKQKKYYSEELQKDIEHVLYNSFVGILNLNGQYVYRTKKDHFKSLQTVESSVLLTSLFLAYKQLQKNQNQGLIGKKNTYKIQMKLNEINELQVLNWEFDQSQSFLLIFQFNQKMIPEAKFNFYLNLFSHYFFEDRVGEISVSEDNSGPSLEIEVDEDINLFDEISDDEIDILFDGLKQKNNELNM